MKVEVIRQRSQFSETVGTVDFASLGKDGSFETIPLSPGRYRLKFLSPKPKAIRVEGGLRNPHGRNSFSRRIEITEANEPFEFLYAPRKQTDTLTEFIPLVFDREQAYYQWRPHDGLKLQQVYGHADKQGVTEELIRLLDDEFTPRVRVINTRTCCLKTFA